MSELMEDWMKELPQDSGSHKTKLSIVGAGRVGSTLAFASMIENVSDSIVMIDKNEMLAEGEAMDILHGLPFTCRTSISSGGYEECLDSDVIAICAGIPRKAGQSRLDLTKMNLDVVMDIMGSIPGIKEDAVFVVITNPVDIITKAVQKISKLPPERVIGTGTLLDTSRLCSMLSVYFNENPCNIQANVLGEHGDSQVITWSSSAISGSPLQDCSVSKGVKWDDSIKSQFENRVKSSGAEIIKRKGSSFFAISVAASHVLKSIMKNEAREFTLSTVLNGDHGFSDVALSLPFLVGRSGRTGFMDLNLSENERRDLDISAQVLMEAFEQTGI
jgi:L-lactate dehydrogenase